MNSADAKIRAMEYSEELGNYSNIERLIRLHEDQIMSSEEDGTRGRYLKFLERAEPALEYEKIYGVGSLLKLEKSVNQQMIADGLITSQQVESARRHRERQSILPEACA